MVMQADRFNMPKENGFTLVEVMISIVVAMTILAGLMLMFVNQSGQYKYQNKRIDTVQDLEFGIKFIEEDLRSALVGGETIDIATAGGGDPYTATLDFVVWDTKCGDCPSAAATVDGRIQRKYMYDFDTKSLSYDRYANVASSDQILPNVTFFKVFDDSVAATAAARGDIYTGMPSALPEINISGPDGLEPTSGYTILIEVAVNAGLKGASPVDVRDNPVTDNRKRVWRYVQVYPMAAVLAPLL